jgi:hypothetical protein
MDEIKNGLEKAEKPISPIMPLMGNLMMNAMPVPVPQMGWETGAIQDFFHNWKLGRIVKASDREATIAQNKARMVAANLDIMDRMMTFSAKIEDQFDQFSHNKEMRKVELSKGQAELIEQQLKNQLLHGEVQLNEVELKIKMKQMEEILGTPTPENRDR